MSGECYSAKSKSMESKASGADHFQSTSLKAGPESVEILEYKTVVSSAENKCKKLKNQIEKIKQFYNSTHGIESTNHKSSIKIPPHLRQNSHAIGTDNSGAALGTINNILTGITKPFEKSKFASTETDSNYINLDHQQLHGVEKIKINSKSKQSVTAKSKFHPKKSKSRVTSIASSTKCKKIPGKPRDYELNKKAASFVSTKRSKRIPLKPRFASKDIPKEIYLPRNPFMTNNTDLVEIYHNAAVKETKSSDSDLVKKKPETPKAKTNIDLIPPLTIEEQDDSARVRNTVSCIYKNYTMPTISSRMKRAAKYYINSLNIKTIPFCLSTSTSPSHNIGINIQQVMSMLKSRQAVGRLSPTLAYNIGLAASKEDNCIFPSDNNTSLLSKNFYTTQCPLSKSTLNYPYLQEVAKTIPQETIEELDETEDVKSPETQSIIITGPSGDVKVKNKKMTTWTASANEQKCTCVVTQPKGTAIQQIVNKFNTASTKNKLNVETPAKMVEKKVLRIEPKEEALKTTTEFTPLQSKEKKLKEVLSKLHGEFEKMTKTYDELVKKSEEGTATPETLKEIESLDKELTSKEEEIVMVMSLYKEVLALKEQVKTLKERTSKDNISMRTQPSRLSGFNNVTTAGLLSQLLQRVQHFQTHYKKH